MSSRSSFACCALSEAAATGMNGRTGSAYVFFAGTDTSSFSGQRRAVSLPPNTQPVSMLIVLLSHSGSGTGVSVHYAGAPAVLGGPVVSNRKSELVSLAGGLAEQREVPHFGRPAALHLRLHAGVRHHESTIVEDVVTDESIQELLDVGAELRRLQFEFVKAAIESMRDVDIAPLELPLQLDVVVARNTQRRSRMRHRHHRLQRVDDTRARGPRGRRQRSPSVLPGGTTGHPRSARSRVAEAVVRVRRSNRERRR